ncbi:MAG: hypothetical protein ABIN41_09270 [Devosia sp.]
MSSISQCGDAIAIAEFWTLQKGRFTFADYEWDEDQLVESYIETIDDPALKRDLQAERGFARTEALEAFRHELFRQVSERQTLMGSGYPFGFDSAKDDFLFAKADFKADIRAQAYVWLSLFLLVDGPSDLVALSKEGRRVFYRQFAKAFEIMCCHILSSRSDGPIWYLGSSRSAATLARRLSDFCAFVGTGRVKAHGALEAHLRNSNDGGVDVLGVWAPGGKVQKDANCLLLGATIQQADRRGKVIGLDNISEFKGFFAYIPHVAFQGVLAVPFEHDEAEAERCRNKNCIYIALADILRHLGTEIADQKSRAQLLRPTRLMRIISREISQLTTVQTNDGNVGVFRA